MALIETVDQVLQTARHKGIQYTIRRGLMTIVDNIGLNIREFFREYHDYFLSIMLGPERTLRMRVAIFRFLCEHNLLDNGHKALWLGRRIRHQALKVTCVDPCKIKYNMRRGQGCPPYIQDGDWDLNKTEFRWNRAVIQLFVDNIPASETEEYQILKEAMEKKDWHGSRGCRTLEDLDAYYRTIEEIHRDYSHGRCLPSSEVKPRYRNKARRYFPDEICVSIDRNGEYMVERGGGHRLSIAQMVKAKKIPVMIIGKHYLYVKSKRDWISCHP